MPIANKMRTNIGKYPLRPIFLEFCLQEQHDDQIRYKELKVIHALVILFMLATLAYGWWLGNVIARIMLFPVFLVISLVAVSKPFDAMMIAGADNTNYVVIGFIVALALA